MAQLSDDSFAFGGPLMTVADMQTLIRDRLAPVAETERIALKDARGRVLAADILALQNELVAQAGRKPAIAWENQIDFSDEVEADSE